jgi:hypothetical protein
MSDGDRLTRPIPREPERKLGDDGPNVPDVRKPSGDNELMKRIKKIDPDQAKKYRQRSGE